MSAAPGRPKQARTAGEAEGASVNSAPGHPRQARTAGEAEGTSVSLARLPAAAQHRSALHGGLP
jgi:hypothetical protein